jgi:predicted transcriptional regulator of viral defense system
MTRATERALKIIAAHGGTIRTGEALSAGIHPRTFYALRDTGSLVKVTRGVYRLAGLPPVGDPDLALVASRIPNGVVCLISALALHELTTQIPHTVHIAIPRTARYPACNDVPLTVYRFSPASYDVGVIEHDIGGALVRVYDPEKTIADCFKFRNRIGIDIVTEALATYRRTNGASNQKVLDYARVNRVDRKILPYLEALS